MRDGSGTPRARVVSQMPELLITLEVLAGWRVAPEQLICNIGIWNAQLLTVGSATGN